VTFETETPALLRADVFFQCRRCGDCCRGYGGTVVSAEDIAVMADFLGMPPERFIRRYCVWSGRQQVLAQQANGYCVFWDGLCRIHTVKPRMCRQWPFIRSVAADPANWQAMASMCPGINRDVPASMIQAFVQRLQAAADA